MINIKAYNIEEEAKLSNDKKKFFVIHEAAPNQSFALCACRSQYKENN